MGPVSWVIQVSANNRRVLKNERCRWNRSEEMQLQKKGTEMNITGFDDGVREVVPPVPPQKNAALRHPDFSPVRPMLDS